MTWIKKGRLFIYLFSNELFRTLTISYHLSSLTAFKVRIMSEGKVALELPINTLIAKSS
jgi:hypothetical protein